MDVLERLFRIARAHLETRERVEWANGESESAFEGRGRYEYREDPATGNGQDPQLAGFYANLELPYGADREAVRRAWKRLMKKYHPDLHGKNPEKREIANQLTAELTRAYQELEKAFEEGRIDRRMHP